MQTQQDLAVENRLLRQEITFLKEELAQLKRLIFGSKKERFIPADSNQQSLFEEEKVEVAPEKETVTYEREKPAKKGNAKRLLLPAHLPRQEETIYPEGVDIDNCTKIGEKVTEVLEYTPGKFYVQKTVRPVYKQHQEIVVAELPTQVIPSGNAGASVLAYLMVSKFMDHLPFYRQVQIFKRDGMTIPESTITGWYRKTSELLMPLYEVMLEQIKSVDYIQADESPIPVLSVDKPGSTHKGYQWVFLLPKVKMVVFKYDQSRGQCVPEEILQDFSGCLQTDGYAGYNRQGNRSDITHIACMAHVRRKFDEAKENNMALASHALEQIQQLYQIEREANEASLSADQTAALRQQKAIPILNDLKTWLDEEYTKALPKSAIGKAIAYSLRLWPQLTTYTQNGHWQIDNNAVENKIRPLALGRKNYLFAGSHQAAQQAAMMYSLLGTCKINGIEPLKWLTDTLRKLPDTKTSQLHQLLPINKENQTS